MNQKTLLLIDDDLTSLELIDFVLKMHGYKTILGSRADEALRLIKEHKPDLIVLDLLLPDMHGSELCRLIKSNPESMDIPILFLSAMVSEKEVEAVFRAGATGYIFKPFDNAQVIKKIEDILKVSVK